MSASSLAALFDKALEIFRQALAGGDSDFRRYVEGRTNTEQLLDVLSDENEVANARLAAALHLTIAGDKRAIPVLRLVFDSPGFAASEYYIEQGLAALGLAILGDVDSLPRVRSCSRVRLSGYFSDIAGVLIEETTKARAS